MKRVRTREFEFKVRKRPTLLLGVLPGVGATKGSGETARGGVIAPEQDIVVGVMDTKKSE